MEPDGAEDVEIDMEMMSRRPAHALLLALAIALSAAACSAGAAIPPSASPSPPASTATAMLSGSVTAGPVCPVEKVPPDPSCAPRVVHGAHLLIRDANDKVVATLTTDAKGAFSVTLPLGTYTIVAQPVTGLLRAPDAKQVVLGTSGLFGVALSYDTGIR
jgi:hypothetical protein